MVTPIRWGNVPTNRVILWGPETGVRQTSHILS